MLGENVAFHRRKAKLTQAQLADMVGVTSGFISMLETGRSSASDETLLKIANALGVNYDVLARGEQRPLEVLVSKLLSLTKDESIVWEKAKLGGDIVEKFELDQGSFSSLLWDDVLLSVTVPGKGMSSDKYYLVTSGPVVYLLLTLESWTAKPMRPTRSVTNKVLGSSEDIRGVRDLFYAAQISEEGKSPIFTALDNLDRFQKSD